MRARCLDLSIETWQFWKRAERVHRELFAHAVRDRAGLLPERAVVLLDAVDESLELPAQGDASGAEDELVEVLPVPGIHGEPRVDVRVHEHIVEQRKVRQGAIPGAILEHRVGRATLTVENDMRWMRCRKPTPFGDGERITARQRS